jgi:hypothetical protein
MRPDLRITQHKRSLENLYYLTIAICHKILEALNLAPTLKVQATSLTLERYTASKS